MVNSLSCRIDCTKNDGHDKCAEWATTAVAGYANPERHRNGKPWEILLSVRKNLKASTDDCSRWMEAVKREQKKPKPK